MSCGTRHLTIGFIGTGARASAYAMNLLASEEVSVSIPAICDVNAGHMEEFSALFCGEAAKYSDYHTMLRDYPNLDGIVITTPNHLHEPPALAALETGAHIILEKPLSTTPQSCLNILKASREHNRSVTLGFVLRYTPFYRRIKELVDSGACGRVLTVSAEEIVHKDVTRFFAAGWRRTIEASGSLVLEKCCHDMDIFSWILGKMPVRVYSFGSTTNFVSKAGAGPRCRECNVTDDCPYYFGDLDEVKKRTHEARYLITWSDDCVYNSGMELCDHQVVGMEFEDGTLLNLTISLGCDISTRTIRLIGTHGRVEGDLGTGRVSVGNLAEMKSETYMVSDDGTGHHGGDGEICRSFIRCITEPGYQPKSTLEDGFHSAMLSFAVEKSRLAGRPVELAEVYADLGLDRWSSQI